jgi:hypothetical protein
MHPVQESFCPGALYQSCSICNLVSARKKIHDHSFGLPQVVLSLVNICHDVFPKT